MSAPGASGATGGGPLAGAADRTRNGSLRVAAVFSDHMVLQRETPIAVFGTAPAGERVVIDLTDAQGVTVAQTMATAQTGGEHETEAPWLAILPSLPASGPYTMRVSHETDRLDFTDVMIGEVWLAGGQSNMELELHTSEHGAEAITAASDPLLRFYNTPKAGRIDEAAESASGWKPAVVPQVAGMSAVAYHFGARLRAQFGADVAVGIIDCYIGGTSITSWMSRATLIGSDAGRPYVERYEAAIAGKTEEQMRAEADEWQTVFDRWNNSAAAMKEAHPDITQPQIDAEIGPCPWPPPVTPFSERRVSAPYEAMVRRVAPYTLRGFLWYQGEEDEAQCESYRELLGLLIEEWRTLWNLGGYAEPTAGYQADAGADALPFIVVQLPQWIDGQVAARGEDPRHWPVIRAAQLDASETLDDVLLVCTMDCGEFDNIHPLDKTTVGTRIADMALHGVYGRADVEAESPRVVGVAPAPGALDVTFTNAQRLHWRGTTPDTMRAAAGATGARAVGESGFEITGADGVYVDAGAQILPGDGERVTVRVEAPQVDSPTAVRYAWKSWGPAPLFNGAELPALPYVG
ncbi:9-O-acetylesterase [Bifidobacterium pseudolongum subsp. pseudolongum]|uniref:9-O-acetylesterase n=1 Tax=Bifidobacterium pseudolongum subsp. pseudolongum TaxID=31954 RepID=A0A4Q5ACC5_9BIFI|nr:sialate O-acetylesterase [Bifidobacterium pseudolongum]RYQ23458.1 9-O-acetylesterase [Bifidobacterium pseudolongum subsp. pseudolongum]